jgi:hypothetical protein
MDLLVRKTTNRRGLWCGLISKAAPRVVGGSTNWNSTLYIASWKRGVHSDVVRHHMDCMRRYPPEFLDIQPLPEKGTKKKKEELKSAAEGFEAVVGIPASTTLDIIRYAKTQRESNQWKKLLLTWKEIRRGRDVFLKGLGSFDIMEIYERNVSARRTNWSFDILNLLKAKSLRKAYTERMKEYPDKDNRGVASASIEKTSIFEVRSSLARSMAVNVHELITNASPQELKEISFCDQEPPFPPFIEYERVTFRRHESFSRMVNHSFLRKCLYTGATSDDERYDGRSYQSRPFWLVGVHELQALGHFSQVPTYPFLIKLLSKEESCPQRQHLTQHHRFWNNPDNAGSLDEIERASRGGDEGWPQDWMSMEPRQILNIMREHHRIQGLGSDVQYSYLDYLPDSGQLKVLRSAHEIANAGDRLRNCAQMYTSDVERMKRVLVLLEDQNGKAVALGSYSLKDNWGQMGWEQIFEISNRRPSQATIDLYQEYSRILRGWHQESFLPDLRQAEARDLQ